MTGMPKNNSALIATVIIGIIIIFQLFTIQTELKEQIDDLEYRIDSLESSLSNLEYTAEETQTKTDENEYRIDELEDEVNY